MWIFLAHTDLDDALDDFDKKDQRSWSNEEKRTDHKAYSNTEKSLQGLACQGKDEHNRVIIKFNCNPVIASCDKVCYARRPN